MTAPFYRFSEFDGEADAADERWAELMERCDRDTPETMRRLVERAKEKRG